MFCSIIEKKCKKPPYRSHVYKILNWSPYEWDSMQGIWNGVDEIERKPGVKWDIVLNHSYREGGMIRKRQYHIKTVTYWQIVEGWESEGISYGVEDYLRIRMLESLNIDRKDLIKEKKLPEKDRSLTNLVKEKWQEFQKSDPYSAEYAKIDELIYSKFQPIIDQVKKEYKKSDEYKFKVQNEKIKKAKEKEIQQEKKYRDAKNTNDSVFGTGYYDTHYNRDGTPKFNSTEAKEWDRTHNKYEKKSSYTNYSSSGFNFDFGKTSSFSGPDKVMAEELIIAGYKSLAKKYHPDVGGDTESFQTLGSIKDKLLNSL